MNIKDCISIIKNCTTLACEYHIKDKCDYSYEVRENRFECAKEQAIKALEKQIPKKIIAKKKTKSYLGTDYYCPACNKRQLTSYTPSKGDNCCKDCGQKLDWETEREVMRYGKLE